MIAERWYDKGVTGQRAAQAAFASLDQLDDDQHTERVRQMRLHIGLYENRDLQGLDPGEYRSAIPLDDSGALVLNVIQSGVDTLASHMSVKQVRPLFMTDGGDFEEQRRAKAMNRFVMGNFMSEGWYETAAKVFCDAAVTGTGFVLPRVRDGKIIYERCFPSEIVVDEQASLNDEPQVMFRRKWVPYDRLAAMYPKFRPEIEAAATSSPARGARKLTAQLIELVQATHLRSAKKAKDGRQLLCIKDCVLAEDTEYDQDTHEIKRLLWTPRRRGFYGKGIPEHLRGLQAEINTILQTIQDNHRVHGHPWLLSPRSARIRSAYFTDENDNVIEYDGSVPPSLVAPPMTNPEMYKHLWELHQKAYEEIGLSMLSANSQKPAGLESGRALRIYLDTESRRFAKTQREWENFNLSVAKRTVELAKENPEITVKWTDKHKFYAIKWGEVDLEEDKYVIKLWPTNLLPDTPSGKLSAVEEMIGSGIIGPEEAKSLLEYPDLESVQSIETAAYESFKMIRDHMVESGEFIPPEPWMELEMGIRTMMKSWAFGLVNDWPQDRMDLLVEWMMMAKELVKAAEPPQPPQMPGMPPGMPPMPGMPPGTPGAPPGMPPGMPQAPQAPPMPDQPPVAPGPTM